MTQVEIVKLRSVNRTEGEEVPKSTLMLAMGVFDTLADGSLIDSMSLHHLALYCKHGTPIDPIFRATLQMKGLLDADGKVHPDISKIVRATFIDRGLDSRRVDPLLELTPVTNS